TNRNCIITYDLRIDPAPLLGLRPDAIADRLFTLSTDLPEETHRIALKGIHLNMSPILAPFEMMKDAEAQRLALDIDQCRRHWKAIRDHMDTVEAKAIAVFDNSGFGTSENPESALYDGFVGDKDR